MKSSLTLLLAVTCVSFLAAVVSIAQVNIDADGRYDEDSSVIIMREDQLWRRRLGKKCPSGTNLLPDGDDGYCKCCSKTNPRICLKMIVKCNEDGKDDCDKRKDTCCGCVEKCKKRESGQNAKNDCIKQKCKKKAKKLALCKYDLKSKWKKAIKKVCNHKI